MNHRISLILNSIPQDSKVLDLGCVHHSFKRETEDGWVHKFLRQKTRHLLGVDCLEEDVQKLQEKGYTVIVQNVEDLQLDEQFDIIVAGELIEHLQNLADFFDSCHRTLESEGKLILTTPNAWNWFNFSSMLLRGYTPVNQEHTCWFDKITLSQLARRNGFAVRQFEYIKPDGNAKWRWISNLFYSLGMKPIGGVGLFFVLEKAAQ